MSPARRSVGPSEGYRRRRYTLPHRRRGPWLRLVRPLLVALLAVGAPLAGVLWLLTTPRFALAETHVVGTERVPREWVASRLEPLRGRHLLRLPLTELESRLADHPWIDGLEVSKRLPDAVEITVLERRPAALWRRGGELVYLDGQGRPIDRFDPARGPGDLLLVAGPGDAPPEVARALAAAAELTRTAPAWGEALSEIELLPEGDLRVYTAALPFALLLSGTGIEAGARRLKRYLPQILERYRPETVDLRFPGRIVVRSAAPVPGNEES